MHLSEDELRGILNAARAKVDIGDRYRHKKGGLYIVKDIVLLEGGEAPAVVYFGENTRDIIWVRELGQFLERFEIAKK